MERRETETQGEMWGYKKGREGSATEGIKDKGKIWFTSVSCSTYCKHTHLYFSTYEDHILSQTTCVGTTLPFSITWNHPFKIKDCEGCNWKPEQSDIQTSYKCDCNICFLASDATLKLIVSNSQTNSPNPLTDLCITKNQIKCPLVPWSLQRDRSTRHILCKRFRS